MMILIIAGIPVFGVAAYFTFNFLSNSIVEYLLVNKPAAQAEVLIVEGWLYEFEQLVPSVSNEFKNGDYKYILISGKSYEAVSQFSGNDTVDSPSSNLAALLMKNGIDPSAIKIVEVFEVNEHKTFSMARAAKKWLLAHDPSVKSVNVCSAGAHGRKTWCAYKRMLGNGINVGVLSFTTGGPLPNKWLERRCGTKWLTYTLAGYLYAKFWPLSFIPD